MEKVSVIIPCRNEKAFINKLLLNILEQDYPKEFLEIFIIDGESNDGTDLIIKDFGTKYSHIKFINNPYKTVPFALNIGIKKATGNIILRMDAHSSYQNNYISQLVYYLIKLKADNVGGVCITTPVNHTLKAQALALVTSNSFGIGNAMFRLEPKEIIEVDTVPFGCFRRTVFEKIGLFDQQLIRNQDDELNARLKQNGGKIFLIPSIKIIYIAREHFKKIFTMFFQYGFFKPLVNKKIKRPASFRQFVPLFFVIYLFLLPFTVFFSLNYFLNYAIPALIYLLLNIIVSIKISTKKRNFKLLPYLIAGFFLVHFSYGYGYLLGIFKFWIFNSHKINNEITPNR